jgi:hypothetical protein
MTSPTLPRCQFGHRQTILDNRHLLSLRHDPKLSRCLRDVARGLGAGRRNAHFAADCLLAGLFHGRGL